ncbi:MAG: S-formylglutathione hydrolase [Neisseriaceae bacterium]
MSALKLIAQHKSFGGVLERYQHDSITTHSIMTFSIYRPPVKEQQRPPCLYCLAGLTCNDEIFPIKSGALQYASQAKIVLVMPDTSPRGANIPDHSLYSLGQGASFYLNASQKPWNFHYQMYDYVTQELPLLISQHFPLGKKKSILGHSMGGHGALMIALKNSNQYQSVSALAPITNPCTTAWGKAAFKHYLGAERTLWKKYDSLHCLAGAARKIPILIHQGLEDEFYPKEVNPELFAQKAKQLHFPIQLKLEKGYDHSYYFVASFIHAHLKFHQKYLY